MMKLPAKKPPATIDICKMRRSNFGVLYQVFSYALSPNDGSECRVRIQSEAEHDFKDVSTMTPGMQIARS
ncbi:hypothetical protein L2E82_30295 [Cichorium intybus]|uniref:Uncharacterized protein n=1 Tax=Cichorium intybus TaxID=13427 RepID=A0ACB9CZU3_CICIN|nr:hypothetical protein L2E82_30295 [Cichorium intybus]